MTATALDFVAGGGLWREVLSTSEKEFQHEFAMLKMDESLLENDESDEDEILAALTRRFNLSDSRSVSCLALNKSHKGLKLSGGSPQSILGGIESWSGRSSNESNHNSPPTTPFESLDNTLGLIYAAAGHVSMLQSVDDPLQASFNRHWGAVAKPKPLQHLNTGFYTDLLMKQKYTAAARQAGDAALFLEHHLQNMKRSESKTHCNSRYGAGYEMFSNKSTLSASYQTKISTNPNYQAIPLQRKESAGTGVFIPRRYNNSSPIMPPRRTLVAPCALVPAKVVQALNVSIETMRASRPHNNSIQNSSALSQQSYDVVMARRRAALLDQQFSSRSPEARLPQEWIY